MSPLDLMIRDLEQQVEDLNFSQLGIKYYVNFILPADPIKSSKSEIDRLASKRKQIKSIMRGKQIELNTLKDLKDKIDGVSNLDAYRVQP